MGVGLAAALALPGVSLSGMSLERVALAAEVPGGMSPEAALKQLMAGNARYVTTQTEHPSQSNDRRVEVAKGQHPIAVILGCADSRVPPELLFDQGLGDLFTVRVAGNIADDAVIGSVEYALEHLGATLVMVLGHERCGAVQAALDLSNSGGEAPGHLGALVGPIKSAVEMAKIQGGDMLDAAVVANVCNVTDQLKTGEPVIAEMVHAGKVKIVGGRYDLDTGEVTLVA
jgi:carbonic anhydrase